MEERRNRKRRAIGRGRGQKTTGLGKHNGKTNHMDRNDNKDETDLCLTDYNSDDNNHIDEMNRDGDDSDTPTEDGKRTSSSSSDPSRRKGMNGLTSPSMILDGGLLDGSGIPREKLSVMRQRAATDKNHKNATSSTAFSSVGGVEPGTGVRKIVYAARTHSQLSQFVGELRRTAWGKSIRVVALGGRKLLCGNTHVLGTNHSSEALVTERCLDLQKGTTSSSSGASGDTKKRKAGEPKPSSGCPLLGSKDAISALAVQMLAQPSDIEDLAGLGKASHTCAYYGSRVRPTCHVSHSCHFH
eukprot:scaffold65134_cov31-Attheya_sp.AAC.1